MFEVSDNLLDERLLLKAKLSKKSLLLQNNNMCFHVFEVIKD